jgi:8-oxo-dGTP pyrophosphatase MutT (NUDIX family)
LPLKVHFAELVFLDKRKVQHSAYRVHVTDSDGITVCGDDSPHQEQILIEYRTPQSDPKNVFCRRLVEYDDICIIGVTNENLVTKFLEPALEERNARGKGFWDRILVIFPTRDSIERVRDQINVAAYRKVEARGGRLSDTDNAASKRRVANWETGRRRVMNFLLQQDTSGRSSDCLEYSGLIPFIGQRFRSPSTRSLASSVRISPILPGADVKKNFYIEVFEKQGTFSPISNALETVFSNSRPLIEWHVHGLNATSSEQNAAFTVCGIIRDRRRKSLSRHLDQHFLLVLVLLHVLDNTGHYIVLQERTPLNASSDFGLLSNISGWVTDRDLFSGLERRLDPDYAEANFATPSGNVPHDDEASQALMRSLCDGSDSQRYALTEEQLDSVAQKAAMREIYEELGLDKTPQRLGKTLILDGDAEKREPAMFFRLFHIQLYPQDCRMVAQNRPDAKLERFRLRDLTKLKKEEDIGSEQHFNHLLRAHFESDFKQIYADLVNGSS